MKIPYASSNDRAGEFLHGRQMRLLICAAAALAGVALAPSPVSAQYITLYGGPTYTPGVGGYQHFGGAGVLVGFDGFGNDGATAAMTLSKFNAAGVNKGTRALRLRFDATGTLVQVTELANLGTDTSGTTYNFARGIDPAGNVVGYADKFDGAHVSKGSRAVRWDATGAVTELGNLGVDPSGRTSINAFHHHTANSLGTLVGGAVKYNAAGAPLGLRAVRWDASGTAATELGDGYATAVNDAGAAVGIGNNGAVRWDAMGGETELGNLGTSPFGYQVSALGINNASTAIGSADKFDDAGAYYGKRAVRWDASGTAAIELGNLGTSGGYAFSSAQAINDAGVIVGWADKFDAAGTYQGYRAVRWDASGAVIELGNLGVSTAGFAQSGANAINASGIAVGNAAKYDGSGMFVGVSPVYWGLNGAAVDLSSLIDPESGWNLISAETISDSGWISGIGEFDPDGPGGQAAYDRLYLLQIPAAAVDLPGDYNRDGAVDAADYVVWRKTGGTQEQYNTWRANFGRSGNSTSGLSFASGSHSNVPEPCGFALLALAAPALERCRRLCARQ